MTTTRNQAGADGLGPRHHRRLPRALLIVAGAATLVTILVGVGAVLAYAAYMRATSIVRYTTPGGRVAVEADRVDGFGQVLVTNKGYALYMFPPDRARRVTCTGDCASAWPPLLVPPGGHLEAGPGVRSELLGTTRSPGGGRVVTYDGWPLYTYIGDRGPRHAAGQAVDDNGGHWHLIRPSGEIVEFHPQEAPRT